MDILKKSNVNERIELAKHGKFLEQFKDDEDCLVRLQVTKQGKFLEQLKDDKHYMVRVEVAKQGKFLEQFKDDKHCLVRAEVAKQGKYLKQLKDDEDLYVRVKALEQLELKKNPIIDNRIVGDIHFATRFKSFVESIIVGDACSSDERDAMVSYADKLLKHQVATATCNDEINVLLTTYDGVDIYDGNVVLYSCMKQPRTGEQILYAKASKLVDRHSNPDRIYFSTVMLVREYIKNNILMYSQKQVDEMMTKFVK